MLDETEILLKVVLNTTNPPNQPTIISIVIIVIHYTAIGLFKKCLKAVKFS